MSAASDSTVITKDTLSPANPLAAFGKYGLPGLVIAVLFFFMYQDRGDAREAAKDSNRIISENTKVQSEIVGVVREMKDALRDNTEEIRKLREERRNRR